MASQHVCTGREPVFVRMKAMRQMKSSSSSLSCKLYISAAAKLLLEPVLQLGLMELMQKRLLLLHILYLVILIRLTIKTTFKTLDSHQPLNSWISLGLAYNQ